MKRKWNVIWDKKIILDISNDNVINVYSSLLFLSSLSLSISLTTSSSIIKNQQRNSKKCKSAFSLLLMKKQELLTSTQFPPFSPNFMQWLAQSFHSLPVKNELHREHLLQSLQQLPSIPSMANTARNRNTTKMTVILFFFIFTVIAS